jgi:hypothetical protein
MKHRTVAILLLLQVALLGCGSEGGPTNPTSRTFPYEMTIEGPLAAHSAYCQNFQQEAPGPAYANAGLAVPIEIGTGRCTGTRSVIARTDSGEVTATLPAGDSFVRFENTGDSSTRFRLTLRYLTLS